MNFTYELSGQGWAELSLAVGEQTYYFEASYLSDALKELLDGVLFLVTGESEEWSISGSKIESFYFNLYGEPLVARWMLERIDAEQVRVKIEKFSNRDFHVLPRREIPNMTGERTVELDVIVHKNDLIREVVSAVRRMLGKAGLVGYKSTWKHEFPLHSFLQLLHYVTHQKRFQVSEVVDRHMEFEQSDLHAEIQLLTLLLGEEKAE